MKVLHVRATLIIALVVSLALFNISCGGAPSREKLVTIAGYGQQIAGVIEVNRTLPDTLLAHGDISVELHAKLIDAIHRAELSTRAFNAGMTTILASDNPDLSVLLPVVADLITHARTIGGLTSNKTWQQSLLGFEIGLRAIATYFATHVKEARAQVERARKLGISEARINRALSRYDVRAAIVVEAYAAGQLGVAGA